jgi:predicted component of type VI protein secretion system
MPSSYQLVMRSGPSAGKVFPLEKGEIVIGRDLNNDVVINDPEISRRHARLYAQGSTYVLEDLGSTNGTFVGGQRLTGAYPLRIGELITFGERLTVIFDLTQPAEAATVVSPAQQPPVYQPPYQPPAQAGQVHSVVPPAVQQPVSMPPQQIPVQPAQVYQQPVQAPVQIPAYQSQAPIAPQDAYTGQAPYDEAIEPPKKKKTTLILLIVLAAVLVVSCICVFVLLWNAPLEFWCQFPIWPSGACQ